MIVITREKLKRKSNRKVLLHETTVLKGLFSKCWGEELLQESPVLYQEGPVFHLRAGQRRAGEGKGGALYAVCF